MLNCISWLHQSIPLFGDPTESRCSVFTVLPSVVSVTSLLSLPTCFPSSHWSIAHGFGFLLGY